MNYQVLFRSTIHSRYYSFLSLDIETPLFGVGVEREPGSAASCQPAEKSTAWKTDDCDADADSDTNTNTYTGRAGQAKISFRQSKKIDDDYDNDNRSACAQLTTTELQANKGRGGDGGTTEH